MKGHMKTILLCVVIVTLGAFTSCSSTPATTSTTTTETTVQRPATTETQTVRTY